MSERSLGSVARMLLGVLSVCPVAAAQNSTLHAGDRVVLVGGTFADLMREEDTFETLLLTRHPALELTVRNLGWAGDRLGRRARPTGFPPLTTTLQGLQADLVIACFGMGEAIEGSDELDRLPDLGHAFLDSLSRVRVDGVAPRVVLVSPIACEDLGERTPHHAVLRESLARCVELFHELADARELLFVDLFTPTLEVLSQPDAPRLTRNGVHPNELGQWLCGQLLAEALAGEPVVCEVRVDLATSEIRAEAAGIHQWRGTQDSLTVEVEPRFLPPPPPPVTETLPGAMQHFLGPRLTVSGLEPGRYVLRVDGQEVASAVAADWQRGQWLGPVASAELDQWQQLGRLQRAIRHKNLAFHHRYRALNTVHTIGERRASPSGRALPDEHREMDAQVDELERDLLPLVRAGGVQTWVLTREDSP